MIVWVVKDGKPGHENQVMGLVDAMAERCPVEVHAIRPLSFLGALVAIAFRRSPADKRLPQPDFIIGAGHATHMTLLAARRASRGKAIVLMKPSLPCRWFDLCIVPTHDQPEKSSQVFQTRGVLNRMRAAAMKDPARGLILIGGESRHGDWRNADIVRQIQAVVEQDRQVQWTLTTSRRTPDNFLPQLAIEANNLTVVPEAKTGPGWLQQRLAESAWAWVTEDSVSMLYESLTAGTAVGVLEISNKKDSRVIRGVHALQAEGLVTFFTDWLARPRLTLPRTPFNEAARCAEEILRRWPVGV